MKVLPFALCTLAVLIPAFALAGSAEDDYIATEDAYLAAIAKDADSGKSEEDAKAADDKAIADLKARLVGLLGTLKIAGMAADPTFQPETLQQGYIEFGELDGLRYADEDESHSLFVTTERLVDHWRKWRAEDDDGDAFKAGLAAMLKSDDLYTYSIGGDAAFLSTVDLPVPDADKAGIVRLSLGIFTQEDDGMSMPDTIVLAKDTDGRVTIASRPLRTTVKPIKACAKLRAAVGKETEAYYQAGDDNLDKLDKALAKYRACFGDNLAKQPYYAALMDEAAALVAFANDPK